MNYPNLSREGPLRRSAGLIWLASIGITVAVTVLVVTSAGARTQTAIPEENGVVHACYRNHSGDKEDNGEVRLVSDPVNCKNNETSLAWAVQGQTGGTGPQGNRGVPGPQGPPGPPGATGVAEIEIVSVRDQQAHGVVTVNCPQGKTVLSGGARTRAGMLIDSYPGSSTSWTARADPRFTEPVPDLEVFAVCARVQQ